MVFKSFMGARLFEHLNEEIGTLVEAQHLAFDAAAALGDANRRLASFRSPKLIEAPPEL